MAIEKIDHDLCTGCEQCVLSCPMDVIRMDEEINKAVIKYVEDCMYCGFCVDCPEKAITILPGPTQSVTLGWG
jgi:NAD-dependent dihydropyrimidine dehydrogenase PreA subunit